MQEGTPPLDGSYRVGYGGRTTPPLRYDASEAAIVAAMEVSHSRSSLCCPEKNALIWILEAEDGLMFANLNIGLFKHFKMCRAQCSKRRILLWDCLAVPPYLIRCRNYLRVRHDASFVAQRYVRCYGNVRIYRTLVS